MLKIVTLLITATATIYYNRFNILLEIIPLYKKNPEISYNLYNMIFNKLSIESGTETDKLTKILIKQALIENLQRKYLLESYKKIRIKPHIGEGIQEAKERKIVEQQLFWKLVLLPNRNTSITNSLNFPSLMSH